MRLMLFSCLHGRCQAQASSQYGAFNPERSILRNCDTSDPFVPAKYPDFRPDLSQYADIGFLPYTWLPKFA
jgi:hypothetical protein